jgi:hypothetical protein
LAVGCWPEAFAGKATAEPGSAANLNCMYIVYAGFNSVLNDRFERRDGDFVAPLNNVGRFVCIRFNFDPLGH